MPPINNISNEEQTTILNSSLLKRNILIQINPTIKSNTIFITSLLHGESSAKS